VPLAHLWRETVYIRGFRAITALFGVRYRVPRE
jgi:hypothetical protein